MALPARLEGSDPALRVGGATATDIGGHHENQDRGIIIPLPDGGMLAVTADGHGPHGARAAQWATEWIAAHPTAPLNAATFALIDEHIRIQLIAHLEATRTAYIQFGRALYKPGFYGTRGLPIRGGTTFSVAAVSPDGRVSAAHVGDSDIHVFDDPAHGGSAEGERLLAQPDSRPVGTTVSLTGDHTPSCRAEYDRIRVTHPGARFIMEAAAIGLPRSMDRQVWVAAPEGGQQLNPAASANPLGISHPSVELNPEGPFHFTDVRDGWATYIRTPDDSEGLAMTRALGDFNLQLTAGVSTVPHTQALGPIDPAVAGLKERVVVVASDGFWDIVHYAEIAEVIWRPENRGCGCAAAEATATALLALAKAKTLERLGSPGDNITVSVVRVAVPAAAAAAGEEGPHLGDAAPVGGAGAAAPPEAGHPLDDPAIWEAAVTGVLPGVHQDMEDGMLPPLGHSPNTRQMREGEEAMIHQGVRRGTGVIYHWRGSTQRLLYCSQSGEYWDIVYQRLEADDPGDPHARWRIVGYRRWPSYGLGGGSILPQPAPLPHVHLPAGVPPP